LAADAVTAAALVVVLADSAEQRLSRSRGRNRISESGGMRCGSCCCGSAVIMPLLRFRPRTPLKMRRSAAIARSPRGCVVTTMRPPKEIRR
jgi:hypothetical protein